MENLMDGKVATLAGVVALAAAPAIAMANTPVVPVATSYAELLQPIPNATERLQLADAQDQARDAMLIPAQWNGNNHHHHHHHHNHYSRYWYQQHGYYFYGGRWVLRPVRRYHHHHHNYHHHHHNYY
jgi:hypothetical protein